MLSDATETLNSLNDCHVGTSQNVDQGNAFDDPRFLDRYIKGEVHVTALFRCGGYPQEFAALFNSGAIGKAGGLHGFPLNRAEGRERECHSEKCAMLVNVVQPLKTPQSIVASLVWLDLADNIHRFLPHAMYFSIKRSFLICGDRRIIGDWERRCFGGSVLLGQNEFPCEIVERAPQVLENISSNECDIVRNRLVPFDVIDSVSRLHIGLSSDAVGTRVDEAPNDGLEIVDVLIGPLDL